MSRVNPTDQCLPSALGLAGKLSGIVQGRSVAVFLDYDGTLSPIVDRPEDARLSPSMQNTIRRLGKLCRVAIVSGRDLTDLRTRVGVEGVYYAGSHGFDFSAPDGTEWHYQEGAEFGPVLESAESALRAQLGTVNGVTVERKRFSIAVHYRLSAPRDLAGIEHVVRDVLDDHSGLRDMPGKMVHDLRPAVDWGKGAAVAWMLDRLGLDNGKALPVFIGDDRTDEDAFAAVDGRGIGILVSEVPCRTRASYVLLNTEEVSEFLEVLVQTLVLGSECRD